MNYDPGFYGQELNSKKIALTFDDGPHPRNTRKIVNILEEYETPATFFFLGENILKHQKLAREVYERGFEIGNHSFTHSENVHQSPERLRFELNATNKLIAQTTNYTTILYRPPFLLDIGTDPVPNPDDDSKPLKWALEQGYLPVGADIDPRDWQADSPEQIANHVIDHAKDGHIVLLHDGGREARLAISALPQIIESLRADGYKFVVVSELLGFTRQEAMPPVIINTSNYQSPLDLFYVKAAANYSLVIQFLIGMLIVLALFRLSFVLIIFFMLKIKNIKPHMNIAGSKSFRNDISVLIPAYNEEKNIEATINSILKNTYPIKEIIVIDDGSKDRTADITKALAQQSPVPINLIRVANGGKARALNIGIKNVKSDIIIALDADTIFHPHAIKHLVGHFKDRRVGAVAGKVMPVRATNIISAFQSIEYLVSQNIEKYTFGALNAIGVIPGAVGAWRLSLIKKAGGYSTDTLVEDQDLTLAILTQNKRIVYEPKALAFTETPVKINDFIKQRFRWIFGTFQCSWKYRRFFFNKKQANLGFLILPNVFLYSVIVPLFSPLIDLLLVISIFSGNWQKALLAYNLFTLFDIAYAALGLYKEKGYRNLLAMIPIQRLFYRQLLYFVVIKSLVWVIEGRMARWNKLERSGYLKRFYKEAFNKNATA